MRHPGQWWGQPPEITQCVGTEPFWSLTRRDDLLTLRRPDDSDVKIDEAYYVGSLNSRDSFALSGSSIAQGITVAIRAQTCSDGMSDREFGIAADVVLEDAFDAFLFSGCCTIAPPAE